MAPDGNNWSSSELPRALAYVFATVFAVAALAALVYWLQFYVRLDRPLSTDPEAWGQLGDYVGGILNPIIALAALLLLAVGVRIQNETFREAREQLALQRVELEQTRAILKQQSQELAIQADAAQRQVFEATFFRLLESLRRLVEAYEISATSRGITAMFDWAVELRDYGGRRLAAEQCTPDAAAAVVEQWYPTHRPRLASYFALVLMILEFVEKNNQPDAIFYTDILRATLSPGEMFLLFHHGAGSEGNARFKVLAEKYGLLDSFDPAIFDLPNQRRLWYAASRIPRNYTVSVSSPDLL
jgi:hypothetical protein